METIELRTDKRPTAFLGEEIFNERTEKVDARYTIVRVFENYTDGGYIVGIKKVTFWRDEEDKYEVTTFEHGREIRSFIEGEIPDLNLDNLPDLTKEIKPLPKPTERKTGNGRRRNSKKEEVSNKPVGS